MKARIIQLISSPEIISEEDLPLLEQEIAVQPFAQSVRALYLLGIKKYKADQFQTVLSTTAAYTTDKKILYQLINGKTYEAFVPEEVQRTELATEETPAIVLEDPDTDRQVVEEAITEQQHNNSTSVLNDVDEGNWLAAVPKLPLPKKVMTDGEVNRILFEGEENFLNEAPTDRIDLEASAETGMLVSEKIEEPDIEVNHTEKESALEFTQEENFHEMKISENESIKSNLLNETDSKSKGFTDLELIENQIVHKTENIENSASAEVNFHEEPLFMPEIQLSGSVSLDSETMMNIPVKKQNSTENKYETERKKLALEIEQKIVSQKKSNLDSPLFFDDKKEIQDGTIQNKSEIQRIPGNQQDDNDSIILEKEEQNEIEKDSENQNFETPAPALNISFFADDMASLNHQPKPTENASETEKSNVPVFINTWQKWLKIDRAPEDHSAEIEALVPDVKTEAIEKFIFAEPKISRFKEEGTFTVQERKDDISHLMTETLAKLFWSQKLYSKAISGYKILIEKTPEKKNYYEAQIKEIKDSRQK